ncbi:MAG: formate dehydrogenase accessory protein FdhE [Bacillota bacterium]
MSGAKGNPIEVPEELLSFYNELAVIQDKLLESALIPEQKVEEEEIRQHRTERKFWLQILKFPEVLKGFRENIRVMAEFTKNNRPQIAEQINQIMEAIENEDLTEILDRTVWLDTQYFDRLAHEKGLSAGLIVFLVENALRPYLRAWGQELIKYLDEDNWLKPICPICGHKARISRLRPGDGSRLMFCTHCFTEWQYRHLFCPHCENEDPMSLNIITIEGDEVDQIYTCDKCKGYLKTINDKQGGLSRNMLVESARTFFLDLLAEREGFSQPLDDRTKLN